MFMVNMLIYSDDTDEHLRSGPGCGGFWQASRQQHNYKCASTTHLRQLFGTVSLHYIFLACVVVVVGYNNVLGRYSALNNEYSDTDPDSRRQYYW